MSTYKKIFTGQASYYAAYRPVYPNKMYRFILDHLNETRTAWDCGTGSGQVAGYLSNHFKSVHASDINTAQLSYAVQKDNISYSAVPAEKTGYPDRFFDLITVAQAIHWFDFDAFYREAERVSKPEALLAVIGYGCLQVSSPAVDRIIRNLYQSTFGRYFSGCRKYIDEEYKTIPFPFQEIPSPQFQITVTWSPVQLEGFFHSWSPVQKIKEELGLNPAEEAMQEIRGLPDDLSVIEGIFPVYLRLGKIHPEP